MFSLLFPIFLVCRVWHLDKAELSRKCRIPAVWVAPKGMYMEMRVVRRGTAADERRNDTEDRVALYQTGYYSW